MATLDNNHANFSTEQRAQHPQDIPRTGSTDEYGYENQANGFEELSPITILESLANFEHTAPSNDPPTFCEAPPPPALADPPAAPAVSEQRHFESLLRAVDEEAAQANQDHNTTPVKQSAISNPTATLKSRTTTTLTKRKRKSVEYEDDDSFGFIVTAKSHKKPKRIQKEDPDALAREREIWGPEDNEEYDEVGAERQSSLAIPDARAVGVHSAAALFRKPSASSKKYTRPPMAKVYTSLDLSAEQFLHLQAAAKKYMLDEKHPERSDSVGNKGKSETDLVKLKLFECVKSFLEDEGWGEKCWGASAVGAETRKLKWPEMMNKVVTLVTPLLRRMVTNERQRLYAIESRKGNLQATTKKRRNQGSPTPTEEGTPRRNGEQRFSAPSPSPYPAIDPKLDQYQYNVGDGSNIDMADGGLKYKVNIMREHRRIKPPVTLTPASCSGFFNLVHQVYNIIDDHSLDTSIIKVLGPAGLVVVGDEPGWTEAIKAVTDTEWMDGEVKVVVDVKEKQ